MVLFAGHSNAGCDTVLQATMGLRGVTHLFMPVLRSPRANRVLSVPFLTSAATIADGHHVVARNLRLAYEIMKGRLFLVSDTMPTFGRISLTIGDERISLENGRLQSRTGGWRALISALTGRSG